MKKSSYFVQEIMIQESELGKLQTIDGWQIIVIPQTITEERCILRYEVFKDGKRLGRGLIEAVLRRVFAANSFFVPWIKIDVPYRFYVDVNPKAGNLSCKLLDLKV